MLASYGGQIDIGEQVLIGRLCTVFGHGGVHIGAFSMIGPGVVIVSTNHVTTMSGRKFQEQGFTRERIDIGEDVWIGANCSVVAGARIEPRTVVAANSLVDGLLRGGWLYGGIPARRLQIIPESLDPKVSARVDFRTWGLTDWIDPE